MMLEKVIYSEVTLYLTRDHWLDMCLYMQITARYNR
jgi:hypothetical protein